MSFSSWLSGFKTAIKKIIVFFILKQMFSFTTFVMTLFFFNQGRLYSVIPNYVPFTIRLFELLSLMGSLSVYNSVFIRVIVIKFGVC